MLTSLLRREILTTIGRKYDQYLGFRQQDAHEFLRHMLDAMRMEELDVSFAFLGLSSVVASNVRACIRWHDWESVVPLRHLRFSWTVRFPAPACMQSLRRAARWH